MLEDYSPANISVRQLTSQYILNELLRSGASSCIYHVVNNKTLRHSVLKVKSRNTDIDNFTLNRQYTVMNELIGVRGIPECYAFQKTETHIFLEIQRLHKDMFTLLKEKKSLACKEVLYMGGEILKILKVVHSRRIIHRDIKPENIMVDSKGRYYLINFGISTKIKDQAKTLSFKNSRMASIRSKHFVGTTRYASLGAHLNQPLTAMDDIESLLYVMIFLIKKSLPWMNLNVKSANKLYQVGLSKQNTSKNQLCQGLPDCFLLAFNYLDSLDSIKQLDHSLLFGLFASCQPPAQLSFDSQHKNIDSTEKHITMKTQKLKVSRRCSIDKTATTDLPSNIRLTIKKSSPDVDFPLEQLNESGNIEQAKETDAEQMSLSQKFNLLSNKTVSPKFKFFVDMSSRRLM